MGIFKAFLKKYKIARFMLHCSITIILASIAAIVLLPRWEDYRAIEKLGSSDLVAREHAIQAVAHRAKYRPVIFKKLIAQLDTPNHDKFLASWRILQHFDKLNRRDVPEKYFDRYRLYELARSSEKPADKPIDPKLDELTAQNRIFYAYKFITSTQKDKYVPQALEILLKDTQPSVRCSAALLAGKLKNTKAIKQLLADKSPQVQSAAALAVACTHMTELSGEITAALDSALAAGPKYSADQRDLIASCVYALALNDPLPATSKKICDIILNCKDEKLFEQLCISLPIINDENTSKTALELLSKTQADGFAPAMLIIAATNMKLPQASDAALAILRKANAQSNLDEITQAHIIAAIYALDTIGIPCRPEAYEFVEKFWQANRPLMLTDAARLLGKQAAVEPQNIQGSPTKKDCQKLLFKAATYGHELPDGKLLTTPKASAAAAAAAWLLEPAHTEFLISEDSQPSDEELELKFTSAFLVRFSAINEASYPGDYIAWNIGKTQTIDAFALGQWLLPLPGEEHKELNADARTAGAILMAVAANSANQRCDAYDRIDKRLQRESNYFARGSYQCAALMIWPGRDDLQKKVEELLYMPDFPRRRVLTALTFAGDKKVMDYLLLNTHQKDSQLAKELIILGMNEVLAATAESLMTPEAAAYNEVRSWQIKIMRTQWACNRDTMKYGLAFE